MRVTVVSSVFGDYDVPASPVEQDVPTQWVLVTDSESRPPGWRVVWERRPHMHPRLAAKVAKARPDLYDEADVYVWIDGSIEVTSPSFVGFLLERLGDGTLGMFQHPHRSDILAEAYASTTGKYEQQDTLAQAQHYLAKKRVPDLWETGVSIRRGPGWAFGNAWLAEMMRWTYQDQISLPWVVRSMGLTVTPLGPDLRSCGHLTLRRHTDGT